MRCPAPILVTLLGALTGAGSTAGWASEGDRATAAEDRALNYLAREVPRWSRENHCYSCHNNGDAARALYTAVRLGKPVDPEMSLKDTTRWLRQPERWKDKGGDPAFSDKKLASIQFGYALLFALDADRVEDRAPLRRAAQRIAAEQAPDGSWRIDAEGNIGSPATYGRYLATAVARTVLARADAKRFGRRIEKADRWLRQCRPETVLAAAGVLLGLGESEDADARKQRRRCLKILRRGQAENGGWGPYVLSRPEPFDTAVVLLALSRIGLAAKNRDRIRRGRNFLIEAQLDDGSWPPTTRPAGAQSYAQKLSTTGWATLALLRTRSEREGDASR